MNVLMALAFATIATCGDTAPGSDPNLGCPATYTCVWNQYTQEFNCSQLPAIGCAVNNWSADSYQGEWGAGCLCSGFDTNGCTQMWFCGDCSVGSKRTHQQLEKQKHVRDVEWGRVKKLYRN